MVSTDAVRQSRRLRRLGEAGVRSTQVLVHDDCRSALALLRPLLKESENASPLGEAAKLIADAKVTNVVQVKMLSPFRYAGGKTWLVPEVRAWIRSIAYRPSVFVDPFAGGGIVPLSMLAENLVDRIVLCEKDEDVGAVWFLLARGSDRDVKKLCDSILGFKLTREVCEEYLSKPSAGPVEKAFRTILRNRINRGGILAPGASLVKAGENNKGISSRWYPETLVSRITAIRQHSERMEFVQGDAFETISRHRDVGTAAFFVDPPYTAGGKNAGSRLYTHSVVDHEALFASMAKCKGEFMMTYDDSKDVCDLAARYGFDTARVPMKNTHHALKQEIIVRRGSFATF